MIEDAKANCSESPNNLKHEKYTFKRLTSTMFNGKSYYSIVYEKDGEEHEGYSSFSLDVIFDFLKEYFLPEPKQPDSGSASFVNPENMHVRTTDDLISRKQALYLLQKREKELRERNWFREPACDYECAGVDWCINEICCIPSIVPARISAQPDLTKLSQELWAKTCLITDSEGLQHQVIHTTDIRMVVEEVTGWMI